MLARVFVMLNLPVKIWLRFFAWMAVGIVVHFGYGRRHSRRMGAATRRPAVGAPVRSEK